MVSIKDDDESILSLSGFVQLPTDECEPDKAVVSGEYPPKLSLRDEMRKDVKELREKVLNKPDRFDHQPMPCWVVAMAIIGTIGFLFALGAWIGGK